MYILELFQLIRTEYLDIFFNAVSELGNPTFLLPFIAVFFWCINKNHAYKIFFSYFFTGAFVHGFKIVFRIPRPWILNSNIKPVTIALPAATGYSFPSGHAQGSSSIFLAFAHWSKQKFLKVISYIIVALVITSRMYLGVHTPHDVFASLIVTLLILRLLDYVQKSYEIPDGHKLGLFILSIVYALGTYLYVILLIRWEVSTMELLADSVVFASALVGFSVGTYIEDKFIHFRTRCFSIFTQLLKILLGLGGLGAIQYLFHLLPLNTTLVRSISNFLICLWIFGIFPLFIKLVQKKTYSEL